MRPKTVWHTLTTLTHTYSFFYSHDISLVKCSPDTAREYLSKQAQKWVTEAGGKLTGDLDSVCEIAPMTSYGGEGLEELVKGKEIQCPFSL